MPPNFATVSATALSTLCSSRMSQAIGSALPPAFSISSAAVKIVPGEPRVGLHRLGGDGDIGAVARGAQCDGQADAAAGAGDEQCLVTQAHGVPKNSLGSIAGCGRGG